MKRSWLIAAVGAKLGTAPLGHLYPQHLDAEVRVGPRRFLVTSQDVPVGAVLTEERLAVRDIPQAYVETRHVQAADAQNVVTRVAV